MKLTLRGIAVLTIFFLFQATLFSQESTGDKSAKRLTHQMTADEQQRRHEIGKQFIQTDPPTGEITSIAEFDRAVGAVIAYPGEFGIPMSLIRELANSGILTTLVSEQSAENSVRNQYIQARVNMDNCQFMHIPTDSYWTRDFGPMYITYGANQIGIVDFPYNRPRPQDDDAPRSIAEQLGISWFGMPVVHTGGNYMTDGFGFAASTTIAYTENPDISPAVVDQRMQSYLGIDDYSVMQDPNNTYIDHIDCWGKYLGPDKVLIRSVPTSHPQYDEIEATASYFATKISAYGTPYKVYRVFTPQNQPYTNSFIMNDKVFVPIMNSQYDEQALQSYRDAMPGYKVFGFLGKSSTPWESTDALHCRVHEMADLGMLYLKHVPLQGNIEAQPAYNFFAYAKTYGGQAVIADSVILYYRINPNPQTPYTPLNMTNTMGSAWSATLTAPEAGSTVEYYIFAADESGRKEFQPFIGPVDAYKFYVNEKLDAQATINPTSLDFTAMKDTEQTKILTINSTGPISLNYSFAISTSVNDTLIYTLSNSPAPTAYNSNTLTESGWTTLAIEDQSLVENVVVSYTWNTDDYYTEGSLWIESPVGTIFRIGNKQLDGTYMVVCPVFTGESLTGNWKVWIQDAFGDGGHQATNVTLKIIKENESGNWLSINNVNGLIAAGSSADIQVTANAQDMALGSYKALIKLWTNDPEHPLFEIPVTFVVTINTPVTNVLATSNEVEVNPNPFTNELQVDFNLIRETKVVIDLINSNGTRVYSVEKMITAGHQQIEIPGAFLPKGLYLLRVASNNSSESFKLIKGL